MYTPQVIPPGSINSWLKLSLAFVAVISLAAVSSLYTSDESVATTSTNLSASIVIATTWHSLNFLTSDASSLYTVKFTTVPLEFLYVSVLVWPRYTSKSLVLSSVMFTDKSFNSNPAFSNEATVEGSENLVPSKIISRSFQSLDMFAPIT